MSAEFEDKDIYLFTVPIIAVLKTKKKCQNVNGLFS